jgi:hypothetical protein
MSESTELLLPLPQGAVIEWISVATTCRDLDLSEARVKQLLRAGAIQGEIRRNPKTHKRGWRVNAGSVAAYQHEKQNRQAVTEPVTQLAELPQPVPQPVPGEFPAALPLPAPCQWLGLRQAARYSGLSPTSLKAGAESGRIAAWNDGTENRPVWKFRAEALNAIGRLA